MVEDLLISVGVKFIRLPVYSPEFNPCELVFNYIKSKIYRKSIRDGSIPNEIETILSHFTRNKLFEMYKWSRYGGDFLRQILEMQ